MKKLIVPVLLSMVLLTSCSQALYKSKYDWVKVDPAPSRPLKDSLQEKVKSLSLDPAMLIAGTVTDVIASIRDTNAAAPETARVPVETVVHETPSVEAADENISVTDEAAVHSVSDKKSAEVKQQHNGHRKHTGTRKRQRYNDMDWGSLAWSAAGLLILALLLYFGSSPFVQALLIIAEMIMCILTLVAIGLMIYGICWFFGQFIFMFDN